MIDSRFRTKESVSNSDFVICLPYAVTVPTGSVMYADSICLSHAWPTVQSGINDHLYVQEHVAGQAQDTLRTIVLDVGSYNVEELKDHVVAKLNEIGTGGKIVNGTYSATVQHGKLTLSNDVLAVNGKVYIYSKSEANIATLKILFPHYPGADCCELLGLWDTPVLADGTGWIFDGQSMRSQYMDLQHHKQLFFVQ